MQKPHWSACVSWKACWSGWSSPVRRGEASTVRSERPLACTAKQEARAHRLAVQLDRARAADAVLAADVGAGQAGLVADEVGEQQARLDRRARTTVAVDLDRDALVGSCLSSCARAGGSQQRARRTIAADESAAVLGAAVDVAGGLRRRRPRSSRPRPPSSRRPLARQRRPRRRGRARGSAPRASSAIARLARRRLGACRDESTAAPPSAKSPWRRANSTNAEPVRPRGTGTSISIEQLVRLERRSSGESRRSSSAGERLARPRAERTWKRASSAVSATGSSAAGSACATEPPTVPRFRIWTWPDEAHRLGQERRACRRHRRALERRLAGHRADPERAVLASRRSRAPRGR